MNASRFTIFGRIVEGKVVADSVPYFAVGTTANAMYLSLGMEPMTLARLVGIEELRFEIERAKRSDYQLRSVDWCNGARAALDYLGIDAP